MNTNKFLPLLPLDDEYLQAKEARQPPPRSIAATLPSQAFAYDNMCGMHSECIIAYSMHRFGYGSMLTHAFVGCLSCRKTMKAVWNPELAQNIRRYMSKPRNGRTPIGELFLGLGKYSPKSAVAESKWLSNAPDSIPTPAVAIKTPTVVIYDTSQEIEKPMPIPERPHVADNIDTIGDILSISTTLSNEEFHAVVLDEYTKYAPVNTSHLLNVGEGIFSKVELNTIWLYKTVFGINEWYLVLHGAEEHGFYIPKIDTVGVYYTLDQVRTQLVRLSSARSLEDLCVNTLQVPLTGDLVKRLIGAASLTREHGDDNIQDSYRLSRPEEEVTRWAVFATSNHGLFIVDWPSAKPIGEGLAVDLSGTESKAQGMNLAISEDMVDAISPELQGGYLVELLGQLQLR